MSKIVLSFSTLFCLLLLSFSSRANHSHQIDSLFQYAEHLHYKQQDAAEQAYYLCLDVSKKALDSIMITRISMGLAKLYSGVGNYEKAYDIIWELLPYAESPNLIEQKVKVLNKLGNLYMVFEQSENANKSYEAAILLINKHIDNPKKAILLGQLYALKIWIERKTSTDYVKVEQLILESIKQFEIGNAKPFRIHYTKIHLANLYLEMNRFEEALKILYWLKEAYEDKGLPIQTLLYYNLGQYFDQTHQTDSALIYYDKSLTCIDKFNHHLDLKIQIFNQKAILYSETNQYKRAYDALNKSRTVNNLLFSSRISHNKTLFEIRNKYEAKIKVQEDNFKNQHLNLLKKEHRYTQLKWFTLLFIVCTLIITIFYFSNRKHKINQVKQNKKHKKQTDILKAQEEALELKNKELLSSALQLLENDNILENIKKQLSGLQVKPENTKVIQQIQNSISSNKSQKWTAFETRFTALNESFFSYLKTSYPALSPTELKMCAFIKLGFSSKDIAQILGISVEGVNTTRSRLRKKLDLPRETNLTDFLQHEIR